MVPNSVEPGKRRAWWTAGAGVLVVLVVLGFWSARHASEFESLARAGKTDAVAAARSLQAKQPAAAKASFDKARGAFTQARDLLGPDWLRALPWLGRQLNAADDLTTIGLEGSAAGGAVAEMLSQAMAVTGDDRLSKILRIVQPHADSALVSLVTVASRIDGLSTEGLVPPLASATTEVQELARPVRVLLRRSQAMLDLERYVFSGQHRFLLVSQNSAELRPTGGFMGSYGLIEFGPEGFHLTRYAAIETLPRDTLNLPIPPGRQVQYNHYYFRNANWWMDFPTTAAQMLPFWENLKQPPIDGIVAIDIPAIRDLVELFGPITVPESEVPLTAENLLDQLMYIVEHKMVDAGPARKQVLVSLSEELLDRIETMKAGEVLPLADALARSANEKHVQVYFTDPHAQASVVAVGWSGAISPPAGTTDVLAVSNGVIKSSKANFGVTKSLDYEIALAADGKATATLRLGYKKSPRLLKGAFQQWLANYTRVHRADGTTMIPGTSPGSESLPDATGMPTFAHYFRLDPGKSTSFSMHFDVPGALRQGLVADPETGITEPDDSGSWHYRLLLAKQADLADTATTVKVQIPPGWKVAGSTARWRVSAGEAPTVNGPSVVSLTTVLKEDLILDVILTQG